MSSWFRRLKSWWDGEGLMDHPDCYGEGRDLRQLTVVFTIPALILLIVMVILVLLGVVTPRWWLW